MLRVTIDLFSGRENPSYALSGAEAEDLLKQVSQNRDVVADIGTTNTGLGLRGTIIEAFADDVGPSELPDTFRINVGGPEDGKSQEFVERLVRGLQQHQASIDGEQPLVEIENYALSLLTTTRRSTGPDTAAWVDHDQEDVTCFVERARFNPDFWNRGGVINTNNCYNYASNRRTNTFAQPGRGAGAQYTALTCPEVSRAAISDGCHRRYVCFPESERPRWLMALVVAPNYDYHWYRQHLLEENFWGHKPGGTAARNTDNRGQIVRNPETADRGPYTHFCGYFYSRASQQNRIR